MNNKLNSFGGSGYGLYLDYLKKLAYKQMVNEIKFTIPINENYKNNEDKVDMEKVKECLTNPDLFDTDEEKAKAFLRRIIKAYEKLSEQGYDYAEFSFGKDAYKYLKTILDMLENDR